MTEKKEKKTACKCKTFSISTQIFKVDEIEKLLLPLPIVKCNKKLEYINAPFSFDIETSSFYKGEEKQAIMYAWVFGINGSCIIGRSWDDFLKCIDKIINYYHTSYGSRHLIIYVHNLSFEMQFFQHYFNWKSVFALDTLKPAKCITNTGIEFRCSYILSGYSLASVGNNLIKYKVNKKVGDLDYKLIRHSKTPLTDLELGYILNDGLIVMAYIQEEIEKNGDITRIPLTKTGYVRKYCKAVCLPRRNLRDYCNYRDLIHNMNIRSINEYNQLKRAFQGGFTHANALYTGIILNNISSFDFTSSYPAVMVTELFPMSMGELIKIKSKKEFIDNINQYCCLFDITFYDLKQRDNVYDNPLSFSKCSYIKNDVINNGRVVKADIVSTTLTDVDFKVFTKFYKWSSIDISNFRRYLKGYLPTPFIKAILKLYQDKTTLKGVEDINSYIKYMVSKEQLNSCYGMCVTDPCRDNINYDDGEWSSEAPNIEKVLNHYNNSKGRFLFYHWGIWVTAYARYNLFTSIYNCGIDYVYSDTDSCKIKNLEKHKKYFDDYNNRMIEKLEKAMNYHNLDINLIKPKTIKGKEKILGLWDFEGTYKRFKTLGAKRYMVENFNDELSITVSGVNKNNAIKYLKYKYKDNTSIFNAFKEDLMIPHEYTYIDEKTKNKEILSGTGKNIHTYIDYAINGKVIDYLGNECDYKELSSVHLEGADYTLSLSNDYIDFISGLQEFIE